MHEVQEWGTMISVEYEYSMGRIIRAPLADIQERGPWKWMFQKLQAELGLHYARA
jgi:hypothetical protein